MEIKEYKYSVAQLQQIQSLLDVITIKGKDSATSLIMISQIIQNGIPVEEGDK